MTTTPLADAREQRVAPSASADRSRQLRLLNGFELMVDGEPAEFPPAEARLVAFLGLRTRPVSRTHVAGALWGDLPESRAAACLRSAIWRANTVHRQTVVSCGRNRVALNPEVQVDVGMVAATAHGQLNRSAEPVDPGILAVELLPGWYDDWVLAERERLRLLFLEALEGMAQALLDADDVHLAIEAAVTIVAADPLREAAYAVLVEGYARAGNRGEAKRQYERCCSVLRAELDLEPGDRLRAALSRASA
jgi:DNA-binding SARP family transcriptional activator